MLCEALDAVGLADYRIGLGDASLYPALLDAHGVPARGARARSCTSSQTRDFVGLEREVEGLRLGAEATAALLEVPQRRGGAGGARRGRRRPRTACAPSTSCSPAAVARARDLRPRASRASLAYYTGAVFEVYDAALGAPLGGGGRYDDLLGRFGRDLPAAGWALNVERLHIALVGERRGERL